jgi:hypothetical protein
MSKLDDGVLDEWRYQMWFEDWVAGEDFEDEPDSKMRRRFEKTITPFWGLMEQIEETLIAGSVRSEPNRQLLAAYRKMPFAKRFKHYIRSAPLRTLTGIDALILLLRGPSSRTSSRDQVLRSRGGKSSARTKIKPLSRPEATTDAGTPPVVQERNGETAPAPITKMRQARSIYSPDAVQLVQQHLKMNQHLNVTQLANQAQITPRTLSNFLKTGKIDRSKAVDIAKAIGMTIEEFLAPEHSQAPDRDAL